MVRVERPLATAETMLAVASCERSSGGRSPFDRLVDFCPRRGDLLPAMRNGRQLDAVVFPAPGRLGQEIREKLGQVAVASRR